ncbi:outer membrane protein [Longimicrobium sp.]|uniref:outer membrane protein n=1 Tax=Longimicrobium sp. TaxID=2029185 RepID=UPI002CEC31F1|nr:outer membrane beta-barrel protein [Longimicrobium sp.]HSU16487.1 outer membrane beta-barrel protein [Longimicrobium sp.]
MTRLRRLLAPALALCAGTTTAARAQAALPVSFEARVGAGIPVGDFGDGAAPGWAVGITARGALKPGVELYGGYDHFAFNTDESVDDDPEADVNIDDDGFRAGLRSNFAVTRVGGASPWLEAGVIVNHTKLRASSGGASASFDSDWMVGFEGGAGLSFPINSMLALTPGVRYRQHRARFTDNGLDGPGSVTTSYFAVDIGVNFRL